VPLLVMPPETVEPVMTAMPLLSAVIVPLPLLVMPPAKVVTLLTLMAAPVAEIAPLLVTPPEKFGVVKNMSLLPEIVPRLLTPPEAFVLRR
jgi:hypothetical protein